MLPTDPQSTGQTGQVCSWLWLVLLSQRLEISYKEELGAGGWRYSVVLGKHFWTNLVLPGGMLGCVVVVVGSCRSRFLP